MLIKALSDSSTAFLDIQHGDVVAVDAIGGEKLIQTGHWERVEEGKVKMVWRYDAAQNLFLRDYGKEQ